MFRGFVVCSDCDLQMVETDDANELSLTVVVFLSTTWHSADLDPTVVALCIETRRAMVPVVSPVSI